MDGERMHPGGPGTAAMDARQVALRALAELAEGRRTAWEALDEVAGGQAVEPRELALAGELVMGVVRHRLTLARILGGLAAHGWKRVDPGLQRILMLAGYQLIWLGGVPDFAAVSAAVEQAKAAGGRRAAGFVNAVLRGLLRAIEQRRVPTAEADPARSVPVDADSSCQFRGAVLTDAAVNPVGHLSEATSHPTWLVGRWARTYGRERAREICRAGSLRAPMVLRPNRLRVAAAELARYLQKEGVEAELSSDGQAVVAANGAGVLRTAAFADGLFQPQDRAAMEPVRQMGLRPGQVVIDLCAGVGTKATQMAEAMGNRGRVLASDVDERRLALLMENCRRLGTSIVQAVPAAELPAEVARLERLDWILVDAPCSNTGVLARRPEARYRLNARVLNSVTAVQRELLDSAARLARSETRLLYSTCSIEPEENEQVSEAFAGSHAGWRLAGSELTLPSAGIRPADWRDGGYWARWEQAGEVNPRGGVADE